MKKSELREMIEQVINELDPRNVRSAANLAQQKDQDDTRSKRLMAAADKGEARRVERELDKFRIEYNKMKGTPENPEPLRKDFSDRKIKVKASVIEMGASRLNPRVVKEMDLEITRINPTAKGIEMLNKNKSVGFGVYLNKKRMVSVGGNDETYSQVSFDRPSALKIIALFRSMGEDINGNNVSVFKATPVNADKGSNPPAIGNSVDSAGLEESSNKLRALVREIIEEVITGNDAVVNSKGAHVNVGDKIAVDKNTRKDYHFSDKADLLLGDTTQVEILELDKETVKIKFLDGKNSGAVKVVNLDDIGCQFVEEYE